METITCTKCGVEKPATVEFFYQDLSRRRSDFYFYKLMSVCKACDTPLESRYNKNMQHIISYVERSSEHLERGLLTMVQMESKKIRLFKYIRNGMLDATYEIDHIHPIKHGGDDHSSNMQLLEISLNREKGIKWPLSTSEVERYRGIRLRFKYYPIQCEVVVSSILYPCEGGRFYREELSSKKMDYRFKGFSV